MGRRVDLCVWTLPAAQPVWPFGLKLIDVLPRIPVASSVHLILQYFNSCGVGKDCTVLWMDAAFSSDFAPAIREWFKMRSGE